MNFFYYIIIFIIYFIGISSNNSDDNPYSWSEIPFHPFTERYKDAPICQTNMQILPAQNLVIFDMMNYYLKKIFFKFKKILIYNNFFSCF